MTEGGRTEGKSPRRPSLLLIKRRDGIFFADARWMDSTGCVGAEPDRAPSRPFASAAFPRGRGRRLDEVRDEDFAVRQSDGEALA